MGLKGVRRAARGIALRWFHLDVRRHPVHGSPEHVLREVVRTLDVDLVIDVGAHAGDFTASLRRHGYTGEVLCVEPSATTFAALGVRLGADARVRLHRGGLGAEEGELDLHVHADQPWLNSLRPTTAYGRAHFGVDDDRTERVRVERLDDLLERLGIDTTERRVLLKVDTQGYDFEVLAGAPRTLSRTCVLQVELSALAFYEGALGLGESLRRLDELGFDISNLAPVARDGIRLAEFDCLLVRRSSS